MVKKSAAAKLKEQVRQHEARQNYRAAAEAYGELSRLEPENPRWPQKAGESYRKLGQKAKVVEAFQHAAEVNATQGFLLKAITLCKMILELDPAHKKTQTMLAELYADQKGERVGESPSPPPAGESAPEITPFRMGF